MGGPTDSGIRPPFCVESRSVELNCGDKSARFLTYEAGAGSETFLHVTQVEGVRYSFQDEGHNEHLDGVHGIVLTRWW